MCQLGGSAVFDFMASRMASHAELSSRAKKILSLAQILSSDDEVLNIIGLSDSDCSMGVGTFPCLCANGAHECHLPPRIVELRHNITQWVSPEDITYGDML